MQRAIYRSATETRRLGQAAPLSVSLLMTIIFAQALVTIPAQFRVIPAISLGGFLSLLFVLQIIFFVLFSHNIEIPCY